MINKTWHLANPMPMKSTLDQRVEWHLEHRKHCACRTDLPPTIAAEIEKRGQSVAPAIKTSASKKAAKPIAFKAEIQGTENGGAYVIVPDKVHAALGGQGRTKILATFEGEPYRGSLARYGGVMMLLILKAIRAKIGKGPGDTIRVTLAVDTAERTVDVPADLTKALNKARTAKAVFEKLSYTHRREYVTWIEAAKRPETRARRIEKAVFMLLEGIKEP